MLRIGQSLSVVAELAESFDLRRTVVEELAESFGLRRTVVAELAESFDLRLRASESLCDFRYLFLEFAT